jgi:sulfoxide reductase heme-binding subunit YedZ
MRSHPHAARLAIWAARLAPLLVLVQLARADDLATAAPVVLGVGALRALAASFAVTPLMTLFGWRWHVILRRDFGRWAFALALLDLAIAGLDTPGGVVAGLAGHAFLALGTLATLLLLPLALTSNAWSQRRLGRYWKRLHLLVYPILAVLVVHLLLLPDGPGSTLQMTWLFGPSLLLRVPAVRRAVIARRRSLRAGGAMKRWSTPRRRRSVATLVALPVLLTAGITAAGIERGGLGAFLSSPDPGTPTARATLSPAPAPAATAPARRPPASRRSPAPRRAAPPAARPARAPARFRPRARRFRVRSVR